MTGPAALPLGTVLRRSRLRAPLVTTGSLALATLALRWRDPYVSGSWGFCPSALLGVACPGCGGLRAVHDLTRGDVVAAASSNLAVLVLMPLAVLALLAWLLDSWTGHPRRRVPPQARAATRAAVLVLLAVFTVLRNTPAGAWLAP
ncbi:MAG: DUF2752 domain-containing protein [Nocardioides sp.]|nr:DUF2752 domain-containing protein [Nocardioides sp.]